MFQSILSVFSTGEGETSASAPDEEDSQQLELSAAARVFATTELLENILEEVGKLDPLTLLLSQAVSKQFQATILGSVRLRRALFFDLEPPKKLVYLTPDWRISAKALAIQAEIDAAPQPIPRVNPFIHYHGPFSNIDDRYRIVFNHEFAWKSVRSCYLDGKAALKTEYRNMWYLFLNDDWTNPLNISPMDDKNASWRRMWVSDPPVMVRSKVTLSKTDPKKFDCVRALKIGDLLEEVRNYRGLGDFQVLAPVNMRLYQTAERYGREERLWMFIAKTYEDVMGGCSLCIDYCSGFYVTCKMMYQRSLGGDGKAVVRAMWALLWPALVLVVGAWAAWLWRKISGG